MESRDFVANMKDHLMYWFVGFVSTGQDAVMVISECRTYIKIENK